MAYAAGGGTDTLARILAEAMAPKLGQSIVIENRPGGATNIGAAAAAKAAPDGYTVFTADNGTLVFNPALFKKLPYDPAKDFRPVGLMARFPLVLAVSSTRSRPTPRSRRAGAGRAGHDRLCLAGRRLAASSDHGAPCPRGRGAAHPCPLQGCGTGAERSGRRPRRSDGGRLPVRRRPSARRQHPAAGRLLGGAARRPAGRAHRAGGAWASPSFEAYAWQGLVVPAGDPGPGRRALTALAGRCARSACSPGCARSASSR